MDIDSISSRSSILTPISPETSNTISSNDHSFLVRDEEYIIDSTVYEAPSRESSIRSIVFSPDGEFISVVGDDQKLSVYNASTLEKVYECSMRGAMRAMVYSPDGTSLAVGGDDKKVSIYDATDSYELVCKKTYEIDGNVVTISFSPDGEYMVVGGSDEKMIILASTTFDVVNEFMLSGWVLTVASSPDGKRIALARDNNIIVYNTETNEEEKTLDVNALVQVIKYSPNGMFLTVARAITLDDNKVTTYHSSSYEVVTEYVRNEEVTTISYSPDSNLLAVGGKDKLLSFYHVSTQRIEKEHFMSHSLVTTAFSPKNNVVAVGGYDKKVTLFNTTSFEVLNEIDKVKDFSPLVYSPMVVDTRQSTRLDTSIIIQEDESIQTFEQNENNIHNITDPELSADNAKVSLVRQNDESLNLDSFEISPKGQGSRSDSLHSSMSRRIENPSLKEETRQNRLLAFMAPVNPSGYTNKKQRCDDIDEEKRYSDLCFLVAWYRRVEDWYEGLARHQQAYLFLFSLYSFIALIMTALILIIIYA